MSDDGGMQRGGRHSEELAWREVYDQIRSFSQRLSLKRCRQQSHDQINLRGQRRRSLEGPHLPPPQPLGPSSPPPKTTRDILNCKNLRQRGCDQITHSRGPNRPLQYGRHSHKLQNRSHQNGQRPLSHRSWASRSR